MKKQRISVLLVLVMLVSLFGMIHPAVLANPEDNILRVATAYDAKSLDPVAVNDVASTNVMRQIYEPLIDIDNEGKVVQGGASLAESYEMVDDKTYRFKLYEGVHFHNGEELKAEDVAFSLERAQKSPQVQHIFGDIDVDTIKCIDDYTIEFSLKEVNTPFLTSLAHSGGYIVNKKFVEEAGDDFGTTQVCGTGPFKFVSWSKNDRVVLEKFDDYHGEEPKLDGIEIIPMPQPSSRLLALEAGDVDMAYELAPMDLAKVEDNPDLDLVRIIENSTQYLGFNNEKEPFNDIRVRKAFAYVIDMPKIVEAVTSGLGQVATGPMGPNIKYSLSKDLEPHEIDLEKAKELMKEAGLEDGFKVTLSTNEKKERVDMAQIIKNMLEPLNVEVEIEILEWSAYLDALSNGDVEMFQIGWSPAVPDPDMALWAPLSSFTIGEGANFSRYNNPKIDELLLKGRSLEDGEEREKVYEEIQNIILDDQPWIFEYNQEASIGVNKNVENFHVTPFSYQSLFTINFKK
ncbi:MAG: ABC transporter substrate-binding protein [Eubacteriales bacterium]|nr:ABC transporter substrate-binding protein [Clostridiales bacterium]MDY5836820.1 ABC transporter substrate-binding protein [Eubacteriales bacterium]